MKIGDIVKIENIGGVYSTYKDWAERNNLTRWNEGRDEEYLPNYKSVYKIIVIDKHTSLDQYAAEYSFAGERNTEILFGLEDLKTHRQYIIGRCDVSFVRNGGQLEFAF